MKFYISMGKINDAIDVKFYAYLQLNGKVNFKVKFEIHFVLGEYS